MDFAKLNRDVAFGRAAGRILWQPRIGCWYSDRMWSGRGLPPPYTEMTWPELYRSLNCSQRVYWYGEAFKIVEHPAVRVSARSLNDTDREILVETPVGRQVEVLRATPNSPRKIHVKWPVSSREELRVATWRAENATWRWDQETFEAVAAQWGDLGAPIMNMPRINIQDLYINTMGTQNAIYALYDWPDETAAYFRALDDCHDRLIDVINRSPVDLVTFGDNLHAGTLSPDLFRRYVLPSYQRRCERLHAAGKFLLAHWDGATKTLLPFARETGLDGIEAITPKPQGDVTLEEIKEALGDDLFLVDGIPAVYFDETFPVEALEECARRVIRMFAPRLILGISDEISSTGDIERIRVVGRIVDEHNARCG